MPKDRSATDPEHSLSIRAAWLHYAGGLTQAAVAKKLAIPSVKAHRLIARAVAEGAVKVTIDGDIVECLELEAALAERFGLESCEVTPDLGEEGLPLRTLGLAGAGYLRRQVESGEFATIGLGHGRTLAAAIRNLPQFEVKGVRFVSLLGGLTRRFAANPHDVMHRIAERTAAPAHVLPVPFFANSAQDRDVLLAQNGVQDVFAMANAAELKLVGIGTVNAETQLVDSGMIEPAEIEEVARAGAVGEILGRFFDAEGKPLETSLTARTIAASCEGPPQDRVVALAGGPEKVCAIHAVLRSGLLSGLLTDEATARALLAQ